MRCLRFKNSRKVGLPMESILRNSLGNDGLTSLRKTRTSEVSTFVKNYNQAQSRTLRKEVEIWYKDTRHKLRSMNDRQNKLYYSLLNLSKAKKTIKTQREDEQRQKIISLESDTKRNELMNRRLNRAKLDRQMAVMNILNLEESTTAKNGPTEASSQLNEKTRRSGNDIQRQPLPRLINMAPDSHHQLNGPITPSQIQNEAKHDGSDEFHHPIMEALPKEKFSGEESKVFDTAYERAIQLIQHENSFSDLAPIPKKHDQRLAGRVLSSPVGIARLPSLTGTNEPLEALPPLRRASRPDKYRETNFSLFGEPIIPENQEVCDLLPVTEYRQTRKIHAKAALPPILRQKKDDENSHSSVKTVGSDKEACKEVASSEPPEKKRKVRVRKLRPVPKPLVDPWKEMSSKSSIQAMEGRQYHVSVYTRDSKGNFLEGTETIDTTVDVAKYFNFASYRDRLTRKKMLEDAKNKERQQRRRVADFLVKMNEDEEKSRRIIELKAKQRNEERSQINQRLSAIDKGPPKYGMMSDALTPGYVRKYIRAPSNTTRTRRERKRSSWCVPSLYTLNASLNGSSYSSQNSGAGHRGSRLLQPSDFGAASHLVNINMDKYLNEPKVNN